ncbi:MAG: hypothetical protein ABEH40_08905 [Haloferacaceae archaeon]
MDARRLPPVAVVALSGLLVVGLVGPAAASPAPVSGCPPCSRGFVHATGAHGLDTGVGHSEATVRVHRNGSATWTVRVVPTNGTVLDRLAANRSLARAVAADSFGTRYGGGIEHELLGAGVADGAVVMRYHTRNVVRRGPFGTLVLTYFRDDPGAYVYTDLGADELTVVAPDGTTVARGFGAVGDDRMTATALPDVRDGPFVVFAPGGSPLPGLLGAVAVAAALGGVVVRNLAYFVALPGAVLVGGIAAIRRRLDAGTARDPTRLGGAVAAAGAALLVGTVVAEGDALPAVTGNLLLGGVAGSTLLVLGAVVAAPRLRRRLTGRRLAGGGVALGVVAALAGGGAVGTGGIHRSLSLLAALLPVVAGVGWADARAAAGGGSPSSRLFAGLSAAVLAGLVAGAPLTALGGTLFLLVPVVLTVAAAGVVVAAVPLYLLGAAGANAGRGTGDG